MDQLTLGRELPELVLSLGSTEILNKKTAFQQRKRTFPPPFQGIRCYSEDDQQQDMTTPRAKTRSVDKTLKMLTNTHDTTSHYLISETTNSFVNEYVSNADTKDALDDNTLDVSYLRRTSKQGFAAWRDGHATVSSQLTVQARIQDFGQGAAEF